MLRILYQQRTRSRKTPDVGGRSIVDRCVAMLSIGLFLNRNVGSFAKTLCALLRAKYEDHDDHQRTRSSR